MEALGRPEKRGFFEEDRLPPQLSVKVITISDVPYESWSDVNLPIDILLIVENDFELSSCLSFLDQPFKSANKEVGHVYFGRIGNASNEEKLKVALVECSKQAASPENSLTVAMKAVEILQPKAVFFVGTCIGLSSKKVSLGDVVIPSKLTAAVGSKVLASSRLGDLARDVTNKWVAPLQNPNALEVKVHHSSNILKQSLTVDHTSDDLHELYPEAIAVETEGISLEAYDDIEWVIVKGVTSYFNQTKSSTSGWMSFASTMAASIVASMLKDPVVFQKWSHYSQERVLMSFKGSPSEMEELKRMISEARLEMEEYKERSQARLRNMEERVLMSFKGSPSEIEELRMISKARSEAMQGYRMFSEARLRMIERVLMSFKGSPSEMEELQRMISFARLEEMEAYTECSQARLRNMEERVLMSFKGSPSEMEDWRSISEEKWKQMEASDVKEGKGDKKSIDEEGKQYSGNGSKDDGGGAEADKTEIQGQEHYEQGSCDDDSSEMSEEDLSREILELQLKDREEPDKVAIFEGTVTSEGFQLDLNVGAIHLTFPPDTVAEPTGIIVYRWKNGACLPQLTEHEAVVSNVIEISPARAGGVLKFNSELKLVLSHSAAGLEGYELVMKRLTDTEENEWEEIARCEDIRQVSDIEDDYPCPKNIPYSFPVVRAGITKCSTYAAVSRLKLSPIFTITVSGGTFSHPDYPLVTITVPQKAVGTETRLSLQLQVQEVPQDVFQGRDIFAGPILRVLCSSRATFLEPVTIQLPVSLGGSVLSIPHDTGCRIRVFFLSTEKETREWMEISDKLENPASFDGRVVKFKVRGFSRYTFLLDWTIHPFSAAASGIVRYLSSIVWNQPLVANFFAYFKPTQRLHSRDILFLICCPAHLRKEVEQECDREKITPCEASSQIKMIPERDKAFVFVSGGISPSCSQDLENIYLCLHNDTQSKAHVEVRLINNEEYCKVEFRNENETFLSGLKWKLSSPCTDHQVSSFSNASVSPLEEARESCSILTSSRKLKVTLLSNEWGSTKGGLPTINRKLAIQLAKDGDVKVCMYLPYVSDKDKKAAADCGVNLLKAKEKPGNESIDWLASIPSDHEMDVLIGHGVHLGKQVPYIKESHPKCKCVHVVHTDAEELGVFKTYIDPTAKGEKKHEAEVKLCQEADLVVAIGPKLADSCSRFCKREKVFDLTPGIFTEFTDTYQDNKERIGFHVLIFGRSDSEDFRIKGYDIAARAVAELNNYDRSFKLVFVGAPSGKEEEVKQMFLNEDILASQLIVRSAKEREQLPQQFSGADLAIMPSRTEAFGLTALEALSAGLPVLVSGNSGLGQALTEVSNGENVVLNSEDPRDWAKKIKAVRRKKKGVRLKEARELRENYAKKYPWEEQCRRLVERMHEIVKS